MKCCTKCKIEKQLTDFNKKRSNSDGLRSICKICHRLESRQWAINNPEKMKINRKKNYPKTKIRRESYLKEYRKKNREKISKRNLKYKDKRNEWTKKKRKTDLLFRIKTRIRKRLKKALKGNYKRGVTIDYLGCSVQEFKDYIQAQFTDGMTWENYGYTGWHLDHIKPLGLFDLAKEEEIKKASHYTNFQPMWLKNHQEKSKNDTKDILTLKALSAKVNI